MSAAGEALVAAVRALVPPGFTHYKGEVDVATPTPPWVVSNVGVPDGVHVSEGAHVSAGDLDVVLTVAGTSEASARVVLQAMVDAFSGARVTAAGWQVGALVRHQRPRVYSANQVDDGPSSSLWAGIVSYRATCSRIPEA